MKRLFSANQATRLPATGRHRDFADCLKNLSISKPFFRKMRTQKAKAPEKDGSDVPAGRTLRWPIQKHTAGEQLSHE